MKPVRKGKTKRATRRDLFGEFGIYFIKSPVSPAAECQNSNRPVWTSQGNETHGLNATGQRANYDFVVISGLKVRPLKERYCVAGKGLPGQALADRKRQANEPIT